MSARNFMTMLKARWDEGKFVCIRLDSECSKIPQCVQKGGVANTIVLFNRLIVEATRDLVCAYKPNAAFYEQYGSEGMLALQRTIYDIHNMAPKVPVILDAKRADIGNTNAGYVKAAFDFMDADAITVNPYFGAEALQPFLDMTDKGIIVLCRTSNKGAGEFQALPVACGQTGHIPIPLYEIVANEVTKGWNKNGNCAVVVGATCPEELARVRNIVGDMPILIPGIGAQGGDVEKTVTAGKDSRGQDMIINSSRGIIFASSGENFAEAARRETAKLSAEIKAALDGKGEAMTRVMQVVTPPAIPPVKDEPTCPKCGHVVTRNGACFKCLNCGESIGCS